MNVCVPRKVISSVLHLAYDAKTASHFGNLKTISRLKNYHLKHKSQNIKKYAQGSLVRQQKKEYLGKQMIDTISLKFPER